MATTPFSVCKEFCAGGGGTSIAKDIEYDNKKSGLAANNVGDAIDEICANMDDIDTSKNWNQNDPKEADYIENRPFYEDGAKVKQLEDKFIPNTIARTADVDKKMNEAAENVDNKIAESLVPFEELKIKPTSQGTMHALPDSAEAPLQGMKIFGKTKQATTTGKNKLPYPYVSKTQTNSGITTTDNGDGSLTISGSGDGVVAHYYKFANGIDLEIGKTYTLDIGNKFSGVSFGFIVIRNGKTEYFVTFTYQDGDTISGVFMNINSTAQLNTTIYPIIVEGSTYDGNWEPYTGGMPSPNPSYPQALESIGDDGSVKQVVCGKNLLPYPYYETSKTSNGVTFTDNGDGSVTISGTSDNYAGYILTKENVFEPGRTYQIKNSGIGQLYCSYKDATGTLKYAGFGTGEKITWSEDCTFVQIYLQLSPNTTISGIAYPIIVEGSTYDGNWEPPKQSQSLTIPTPNGLPGIPVSSGGNYTDENGQQYVSDYKDYERMVYVQRVGEWIYTGGNVQINTCMVYQTSNVIYWNVKVNGVKAPNDFRGSVLSNVFLTDKSVYTNPGHIMTANSTANYFYMSLKASDFGFAYGDGRGSEYKPAITNWMQTTFSEENPLIALYELTEPIETPLSEEEIAAYKALHTNYPNTTIYNDEGAYTEVKYVADTKNYVDNKITNEVAKLTAAIITE